MLSRIVMTFAVAAFLGATTAQAQPAGWGYWNNPFWGNSQVPWNDPRYWGPPGGYGYPSYNPNPNQMPGQTTSSGSAGGPSGNAGGSITGNAGNVR